MAELHTLGAEALRALIRQRFAGTRPERAIESLRIGPFPPEMTSRFRGMFPPNPTPAAVLVPIVDRGDALNVLLTERSSGLKHHAGQVSFPGGRLEPHDEGPVEGALRETEEEIGLGREFVEVVGYLPDHMIISGYQVTPVVAMVRAGFTLALDSSEVAGTFEVPLSHLFDPASRVTRRRRVAGSDIEYEAGEVPWDGRLIWGATAGMLFTLHQLLDEACR
ncbi:MAG: CoA pyrophosphatase [Gammaproteobacteria bacterium]|nr:CoA pyrophosphatase [Gammaproteobacteria bacterium]